MLELRGYQQEAVAAIYRHLRERDDNPCVVIPTGGGKTPVMATVCRDAVGRWKGRVLILAHVKELLEQAVEKLALVAPELWNQVGIYSAGLKCRDTEHPIIVAGIQSVYKRACELDRFDLVIIDEAHMIPPDGDGMYRTFLDDARAVNPRLRVISLTATPFRMKSGHVCAPENVLNHVCYEIGVRELIVQGFLSPLVSKASREKIDTSGLHVRAGEFVAGEAEDLMDTEALVESACREIVEQTRTRRSVLIFAAGVRHGQHIAGVLREKFGAEAGTVFGDTLDFERERMLAEFKAGRLKFLINVNVLTTGFDAPNIDCVAMVRPTMSPGLYYQMCLDMETEVLTPYGWARCEQVGVGDSVGAFDLETGCIEWCAAEEKIHRPLAPGERMYAISAPHLDVRVTHLHTMIYRGRAASCKRWQKRTAESLARVRDSYFIPIAGNGDGPGVPLSDDELRFLGWTLTDGYRNPHNNAVIISQSSRSPWLDTIRATLEGCGFGYRVYRQQRLGLQAGYPDGLQFVVPYGKPRGVNRALDGWGRLADYLNRPVSESLADASRAQLRVLLGAMNLGDGRKPTAISWQPRTMTLCLGEHKLLADQLQALLVRRGFRCNINAARQRTTWHTGEPKPQYQLHVREQTEATVGGASYRPSRLVRRRNKLKETPIHTDEWMWCLRTKFGTLVTRRNGKVAIVGNCGRGFRLHPGKENCLVLDFGGNVLRHGPVDAIRIDEPDKRGSGEAPAKECPECRSLIAAGYAVCPDCGYEFPPPERQQHEATASTEGILSGQVSTSQYPVQEVYYAVHQKRGAPDDAPKTMRVDYRIGFNHWQSEWICFEHAGYARKKAEIWWRRRSNLPVPDTSAQAVTLAEVGALAATKAITVRSVTGEDFDRIVDYELGEKPDCREPGWDDGEEEAVAEHALADDEEVPF